MQRLNRTQRVLLFYSSFVAVISLFVLIWIISSPSEPSNTLLFGFSTPRLAIVVGLIFVIAFYVTIALKTVKNKIWTQQFLERWFEEKGVGSKIGLISGLSFGLGFAGCFLPPYRMGTLENYWARAQPVMVFILLVSLATLIVFFIVRNNLSYRDLNLVYLKSTFPLFTACLLIFGWMVFSGFGVTSSEDYWYGVGVPILTSQLIGAITGGVLFLYFEHQWKSKWMDVSVCILIYMLTAYFWASEPLQRSFFFTGPSNPNHAFYPFSDAANFDIASQFSLIGSRFLVFNSVFFERPLYLSFLTFLHFLFGQDYEILMAVQAGMFAILPVLVYLIGRSLNARAAGLGSAMVAALRGVNSIQASNMIDTAGPKMMLTDFPSAIGVALTILLICEWLKMPESKWHYLVWVGGAIGFTLMLRTNALVLLAFVPVYLVFTRWKQGLIISSLIVLGFVSITLPWEIRNLSLGGHMYAPVVGKIQDVIEQRYLPKPQSDGLSPQGHMNSSMTFKNTDTTSVLYRSNNTIQNDQSCDMAICFSLNHFLHNNINSILILPTSPMWDDIRHLIKNRFPHYWMPDWDGTFSDTAPLFLILNIFLITLGIVFSWKENRLIGLTPLLIFFAYNISNGLARTSGGRYLVPVDWIVPIYFMLGIFCITTWATNSVGRRMRNPEGFNAG